LNKISDGTGYPYFIYLFIYRALLGTSIGVNCPIIFIAASCSTPNPNLA
jgi:hypothetical protein